jgi:hypothetical protein
MRIALIPILALCSGLALAAPPDPAETPGSAMRFEPRLDPALDPRVLLHGMVRDEDMALLFAHFRNALLAAYEGREPPSSDELNQRMEAIGGELRARGLFAGMMLLATFEAAARQALREALTVPPPVGR